MRRNPLAGADGQPGTKPVTPESQALTAPEDVQALQDMVASLQSQLAAKDAALHAAQNASGGAIAMFSNVDEVPTGETVKVKKCINPWVRKAEDLEFEEVELPTYHYRVNLPPSGGVSIKINGVDYYHESVYVVDLDMLRTLKDLAARGWAHESSIMGSNENAYRRPTERVLRGGERRSGGRPH